METWEYVLKKFLNEIHLRDDLVGVLVCGSYITGNPSKHSDLDVHLILADTVEYRERGNRRIDGLLIEYFANPPKQIRQYFKEDYQSIDPMSQTQFATGRILQDATGVVVKLKEEAEEMLKQKYNDVTILLSPIHAYAIWDKLDDLQDAYEIHREDFDFIFYTNLDFLLSTYMKLIKHPYNTKTICGNITNENVRRKYLLEELPDKQVSEMIHQCITNRNQKMRLDAYQSLTKIILDLMGGFDIETFTFRSDCKIDTVV